MAYLGDSRRGRVGGFFGASHVLGLLSCVAGLCAGPARAFDASQLLRVRAGATCLSAESLAPQVEVWLYDAELPADVVIEVEGSEHAAHSASFRVVVAGRTIAHRAFEPGPPRCEHLRAALGLAIALALRASLLEDLGRPLADDPQLQARSDWKLTAAGLASYRTLPSFAPGLELGAERALGEHWSLRAAAFGLWGLRSDFERVAGGFDTRLLAGRGDACIRGTWASWQARVCAGVAAGALYARGRGQADPRSAWLGWLAFANAAALSLTLSERWSLQLAVTLNFPLWRMSIGARDRAGQDVEARALAPVGIVSSLGPSYHF